MFLVNYINCTGQTFLRVRIIFHRSHRNSFSSELLSILSIFSHLRMLSASSFHVYEVPISDKPLPAYASRYLPCLFLFLYMAVLLEYAYDLNNSSAIERPLFATSRFSSVFERNDLKARQNILLSDFLLPLYSFF